MRFPKINEWFGLMLVLLVGWLTLIIGPQWLGINSVIAGLVLGMILGNSVKLPSLLQPGISFSASALLELSIVFLGFEISFRHISQLGIGTFPAIAGIVLLVLLFSIWLSRRMKCPGSTGLLVGFGSAICGSSAIAAAAPRISRNQSDAAIAIAVVNLLGAGGMLLFPLIINAITSTAAQNGFFIGATLHAVGNVAGAGFALGDEAGGFALTVKLARVALLSPAVVLFSFLLQRGEGKKWSEHFRLPLYLWLFIIITLSTAVVSYPLPFLDSMKWLGKWLLSAAMFAIGTKLSLISLYRDGKAALGFGIIVFAVQILVVMMFVLFLF